VKGTLAAKTANETARFAISDTFSLDPIPYAQAKPRLSADRRIPLVYARVSTSLL
jgi:hypothetical protein